MTFADDTKQSIGEQVNVLGQPLGVIVSLTLAVSTFVLIVNGFISEADKLPAYNFLVGEVAMITAITSATQWRVYKIYLLTAVINFVIGSFWFSFAIWR